jgi:hypothetical protein
MSGSDEVGVDPGRVSQAAAALQNLQEVLAANVPVIVNLMNEYWSSGAGSPISLAALHQAQARSIDDATEMLTRARLAEAWLAQKVSLSGNGMVNIPWGNTPASLKELDSLDAKAQAQALADAEAESGQDPKAARAEIASIELGITDHVKSGDAAWLAAFYTAGATPVANLAATLNTEDGKDGVVLTAQDEQILHTYATGLAYAGKYGTLNATTINAFSGAKNLWSVGMLFKFGPPGSAYGTQEKATLNRATGEVDTTPNLLASVTTAIELARMRGGYVIPLTGVGTGAWGADLVTQTISDFDPAQAMLTLATQNGAAAREVLAGPHGEQIASDLMNQPVTFYYPYFGNNGSGSLEGFFPEADPKPYFEGQLQDFSAPLYAMAHPLTLSAGVIGSFFDTATAAPRGTGPAALDSADAAVNLIDATPPPNQVQLPDPVRQALLHTAQRYLYDLADSTDNTGRSIVTTLFDSTEKGMPYTLNINSEQNGGDNTAESRFLKQILSDPGDAGVLEATIKTALGKYYALSVTKGFPAPFQYTALDDNMASLLGRVQTEIDNNKFEGAQRTDEQNAEYNALLSFGESAATKVPVIGSLLGGTETAAGLLGINPQLSTDNAASTAQLDAQEYAVGETKLNVTLVQALINAGVIPDPRIPQSSLQGQQWFQNGHIVLNSTTTSDFTAWYGGIEGHYDLAAKVRQYTQDMNSQQATSSDSP